MFTQDEYDRLYPLACQWTQQQETTILTHGIALTPKQSVAACSAGVREPGRVRLLPVPQIPLPENGALRAAALKTNIISSGCRGLAVGYGIMVRADSWSDYELLAHLLVHVAQYERSGGVEPFLKLFFNERLDSASFGIGPLELEARAVARKVATGD